MRWKGEFFLGGGDFLCGIYLLRKRSEKYLNELKYLFLTTSLVKCKLAFTPATKLFVVHAIRLCATLNY